MAEIAGQRLAEAWEKLFVDPQNFSRDHAQAIAREDLIKLARSEAQIKALQGYSFNPCSAEDWFSQLKFVRPDFLEVDFRYHFYTLITNKWLLCDYNKTSDILMRLCEACNYLISEHSDRIAPRLGRSEFEIEAEFQKTLASAICSYDSSIVGTQRSVRELLLGFVMLSNSVGYITKPVWSSPRAIVFNTTAFDFEYLRSVLFGLWSAVKGFDDLFGGGGPYLFRPNSGQSSRLFVVEGGVGLGKSTLGLSIAADIARKGGFSWMIPFEQTCADCRGYIRDHRMLPESYGVPIREGAVGFRSLVETNSGAATVLLSRGTQETYKAVFQEVVEVASAVETDVVRVVVIDPLNAIIDDVDASDPKSREAVLSFIDEARARGINIIVTAESQEFHHDGRVETFEKLADVVVRLSRTDASLSYSQRFIEVVKSRMQREQRGLHPYSIRSGSGIHVYPASPAIAARLRNRQVRVADERSHFGWRPIDAVLGPDAILRGDVMVFRGTQGTLKTELAAAFALSYEKVSETQRGRSCSVFVPLKDHHGVLRRLLDRKNPRLIRAIRARLEHARLITSWYWTFLQDLSTQAFSFGASSQRSKICEQRGC